MDVFKAYKITIPEGSVNRIIDGRGQVIWTKSGTPVYSGTNPQSPQSMGGGTTPFWTFSDYITFDRTGELKIRIKITRLGDTREYDSGGTHNYEGGYIDFMSGEKNDGYTNPSPSYASRVKSIDMPVNIGESLTYDVKINPQQNYKYFFSFHCAGYSYPTSQEENFGYIGRGVFKLTVSILN